MYSFFGLFVDPVPDLSKQLLAIWPDLAVVSIRDPISARAMRFSTDYFAPEDEDIPESIHVAVKALSAEHPTTRFLLLRTECHGGTCGNCGVVVVNGETAFQAADAAEKGALRRLIAYWGVDLGPREIFAPLYRDFPWREDLGRTE
jgi:ferredoxin